MDKKAPSSKEPKAAKPAAKAAKSVAKPAGDGASKKVAAAAPEGPTCSIEKCKQPVRAKGYCRKHFMGWRRGKVGAKHRYVTCSKEACRKPALPGGRCEEHKKGSAAATAAA
jgi:hypothetical protein